LRGEPDSEVALDACQAIPHVVEARHHLVVVPLSDTRMLFELVGQPHFQTFDLTAEHPVGALDQLAVLAVGPFDPVADLDAVAVLCPYGRDQQCRDRREHHPERSPEDRENRHVDRRACHRFHKAQPTPSFSTTQPETT